LHSGHTHSVHTHSVHAAGDHRHDHGPNDFHAPKEFGRAFAIAAALNLALVIIQIVYGLLGHSIALLADAGHNAGDAFGLLLAWGAHVLSRRGPTQHYTYGFRSASILVSLLNAMILFMATGAIAVEAIRRFYEPAPVEGMTVMVVAAIGIVINAIAAWVLAGGQHDLNIRGAFLHLAADALVSLGVVAAGAAILLTGWNWIDPAASLVISAVIIWGTWGLLRDSVNLSLDAVPAGIDPAAVRSLLAGSAGVARIHDLHIWPMSTSETALTCHLVMPSGHPGDAFIASVCHDLHHRFGIAHSTLQIETGEGACALEPEHVV
jgi:cobalt-zinc-cadmium efflux system protein